MNSEPGSRPDLSVPGDGTDSLPDDGEFGVISIKIARHAHASTQNLAKYLHYANPAEVTPTVL
jgi:hypothetical protein